MIKVRSSLAELKAAVATCELEGAWYKNTVNGFHAFHAETGEVLNWWPSTGTVRFRASVGRNSRRYSPMPSLRNQSWHPESTPRPGNYSSCKVGTVKLAMRSNAIIHHGLQPIALQKGDGSSQPIVEALNQYIRERTGFEIVMLSLRK
jgi:hypothetical protein